MIINHNRTCLALELKILPPDQLHQTLVDGGLMNVAVLTLCPMQSRIAGQKRANLRF